MALILNSLFPVVFIILLGFLLRRFKFLSREAQVGLNKLTYWVLLPILLYAKISQAPDDITSTRQMVIGMSAAALGSFALMYLISVFLRTPERSAGVLIQAAFRGNLAFAGLPIVVYTCRQLPGVNVDAMEAATVLAMIPVVILYNLLSVSVLAWHNRDVDRTDAKRDLLRTLATNPLLIACILGLIAHRYGFRIPSFLDRSFDALVPATPPLALLALGCQLAETRVSREHVTWAAAASLVKNILSPSIGFFVARAVGLEGIELKVTVLMCGMPTAVSSYVLADQMKSDAPLAANAVVICTTLAFFSLSAILWIPM